MILHEVAGIVKERPYFRKRFLEAAEYINLDRYVAMPAQRASLPMLQEADPQETTRAKLATVCPQWLYFFEKLNFRHLILHQDDIAVFGQITQRFQHRRAMVHGIFLRIELSPYGCERCQQGESSFTNYVNSTTVENAIVNLHTALADWNPTSTGLTLELGAYSPSDPKHYARELNLRIADNLHNSFRYLSSRVYLNRVFSNMAHLWRSGVSLLPGSRYRTRIGVVSRIFGHPAGLGWAHSTAVEMPYIFPVVKELVIRRQFYRYFSCNCIGGLTLAMNQLESIRYEAWAAVTPLADRERAEDFILVLRHAIGKRQSSLRRLSIYGCTSNIYHFDWDMYDQFSHMPTGSVKYNILEMSQVLSEETRKLTEIHGARSICAEGFFHEFWPSETFPDGIDPMATAAMQERPPDPDPGFLRAYRVYWPNLTHLSLTTTCLDKDHINPMLTAAGRAAKNMPLLKMMELWNYHPHSRAIFRYASNQGGRDSGVPEIELITSWYALDVTKDDGTVETGVMRKKTKEAWAEAAKLHCQDRNYLKITEHVWPEQRHWDGCVIKHLKMKERILTEVSLEQLELERWEAPT